MTNNDILRRIRYTFNYNDAKMAEIVASTGHVMEQSLITQWLKKEEDEEYVRCSDREFSTFLNGFINEKRGKREEQALPENHLNNNLIFKKLKIALDLKSEDVLDIMDLAEFSISKHELSALFRKADHQHYRECKDQLLRKFLTGMQIKYRDDIEKKPSGANRSRTFTKAPNGEDTDEKVNILKPKNRTTTVTQKATADAPITYGNYNNDKVSVKKMVKKEHGKPTKKVSRKSLSTNSFKWPATKD